MEISPRAIQPLRAKHSMAPYFLVLCPPKSLFSHLEALHNYSQFTLPY